MPFRNERVLGEEGSLVRLTARAAQLERHSRRAGAEVSRGVGVDVGVVIVVIVGVVLSWFVDVYPGCGDAGRGEESEDKGFGLHGADIVNEWVFRFECFS